MCLFNSFLTHKFIFNVHWPFVWFSHNSDLDNQLKLVRVQCNFTACIHSVKCTVNTTNGLHGKVKRRELWRLVLYVICPACWHVYPGAWRGVTQADVTGNECWCEHCPLELSTNLHEVSKCLPTRVFSLFKTVNSRQWVDLNLGRLSAKIINNGRFVSLVILSMILKATVGYYLCIPISCLLMLIVKVLVGAFSKENAL